ncbi:MAG: NADP-dependent oxidoreductase [Rubrivivax sp.]|nr:MAG: NADP-dependent oxidoreductase [Rubrivivax sp.]
MKAVIIEAYGDNQVVQYTDIDRPEPQAGQVRVKVHAAGVNPVDWKVRGGLGQRMGMSLPIVLGGEIAGTVDKLGSDVNGLQEGEAVFGIIGSGGFAEYAVVNAANLTRQPANLDFVHAAAVPLGALTAWQAMFDLGGLAAGQRLLVTNGSGGVGSLAIQMAKARGAHVTAMASGRNEAYVLGLGADEFIDHTQQPFEQVARDMDVVFDTVGGDTFQRAFRTLKPGGALVTAVAFPQDEAQQHGVRASRVFCQSDLGQLVAIRELVEAGQLTPQVTTVLPLADIREALALSEAGRTRGKIVLQIAAQG